MKKIIVTSMFSKAHFFSSVAPTILKNILYLFLQDFVKIESITPSDWLNHQVV